VFFQAPGIIPGQELPASKPVLAIVNACIMLFAYGGLGYIGLLLSAKLGFAPIRDDRISARQRLLIPSLVGLTAGIIFIPADILFAAYYFRKVGFLAPVLIHFCTDLVWHVIWGPIS